MTSKEEFFEIDETENLIDNLEMVAHFLDTSITYKWKWVIIALHQALYSSLIISLQGTDARQTVIDREKDTGKAVMLHVNRIPIDVIASSFGKDEAKILDWITNPYLISLEEALRRIKLKKYLPLSDNAKPLKTTPEEDYAIKKITKEFRNQFEHFTPKAWLVDTSILPPIVNNVVQVIRFLEFESNCAHMSLEQEQRIKSVLAKIEYVLSS